MMIANSLSAFCDILSSQTGAKVILGSPKNTKHGIYVWPWGIQECPFKNNIKRISDENADIIQACKLNLLVMVRPSLTLEGIKKLELAREAVREHPIIERPGMKIHCTLNSIPLYELIKVFIAASIPLTLCLAVELQIICEEN
jgi:hypothetical protein